MRIVQRCLSGVLLLLSPISHAGLVQWYQLEEGATNPTTNLTHSAVSTNIGTLGGSTSPVWVTTNLPPVPPPGTTAALYFNGAPAVIPMPNVTTDFTGISGTAPRSLAAWIKAEANQGTNVPTIIHWGPAGPNGARITFKLDHPAGGGWPLRLEVQGGGVDGTKNLADGQWHHVAATIASASSVSNILLYVDGVREPLSLTNGPAISINTLPNYKVSIGNAIGWDPGRGFTGAIDEVRLYDHALSAAEILVLVYGNGSPPTLTAPLSDQAIILGDSAASATFTPAVGGTPPLGFQWKFYGTNLPTQTNASLVINPAGPANVGPYSVTVSNVFGTTNTSANLRLNTAPIDPPQQVTLVGGPARLSITMPATSTGYTYQWRKDGTNIPGTAATYALANATLADDSTNYTVVVTLAGVSATSSPPAALRVLNVPASTYAGFVLGDGPAGYWRLGETNAATLAVDETTFNPGCYSNYQGSDLGLTGALVNDVNTASGFGPDQNFVQIPYNAQLSRTNALTLEAWVNPTSTGTKQSIISCFGNLPVVGYELYVSSSGDCVFATSRNTSSATENWDTLDGGAVTLGVWTHLAAVLENGTKRIYTNGVLAGTQTATLLAAKAVPIRLGAGTPATAPSAFFSGVVDEPAIYGQALSATQIRNHYLAGIVPAGTAPTIQTQPQPQHVILGDTNTTAVFTVLAGGSPPLQYQWQRNALALPGQTNATLLIPGAGVSGQATYSVLVTNGAGPVLSSDATLTYATAPVSPLSQAELAGAPATFTLTMPAYEPYSYQWKHAGTILPGATTATFTVPETTAADAGAYTVVATLGLDSAESAPAALTVIPSPSQSYSNVVAGDVPVAWWRLNEPAGSVIATEVSGLYPGTIYPDVRLGLEGALLGDTDTAAAFTGYSSGARTGQSRIDVAYSPQLNAGVFSVECWALVSGGAGTFRSPITSRQSVPGYVAGFLFYAGDNDQWQFWLGSGAASFSQLSGPPVVENQWTHLVGTYDGLNAAFYVNGTLVSSGPLPYAPNAQSRLSIGAGSTEAPNGNFFFPGRIDEVALYTTALSVAQVQAHYAAAFPAGAAPRFLAPPLSRGTLVGQPYSLSVPVHSSPPVSFQWQHNGTNLSGASSSTLAFSPVIAANAGTYQLLATHDSASALSPPADLQVLSGEAVSVSFQGFEGFRTIGAGAGYAGYVTLTNWNELGYNSIGGAATNLLNHQGQSNSLLLSWSAANDRRWNGPFSVAKGDAALLNGFLEASSTTNIILSLANIPLVYQDAGYSLYVYLGAPSAAAGIVNPSDSFGAISLGAVTKYYHAVDLAFWEGSFQAAVTTDPLDPSPADANCVVFTNLNSPSLTLVVAPHPMLAGPAALSGFQLVANSLTPAVLTLSRSGGALSLTWPGHWVLQQKSVLDGLPGTWSDLPDAVSPYPLTNPIGTQQYFRLRSP